MDRREWLFGAVAASAAVVGLKGTVKAGNAFKRPPNPNQALERMNASMARLESRILNASPCDVVAIGKADDPNAIRDAIGELSDDV